MSKELKIGIFVTVVLVLSFFLINFLREKDLFNRDIELYSEYASVEGLTVSAPVYFKGFKAGAVSAISYDREKGAFVVTCSVSRDFDIPADSRMLIYNVDIMGSKGVGIQQGTSTEMVKDGAFLEGSVNPDMLSSLAGSLSPLLEKVSFTLDSLNVVVANLCRLTSEENTSSISSSLMHIERTAANAEKISAALERRSPELEAFIADLDDISGKLVSVVEKADTAMTGIGNVVLSLEQSDIEGLVRSFSGLLDAIQDPDGSIGKLLSDRGAYDSLESLLADIDDLIEKIKENPRKYVRISLF